MGQRDPIVRRYRLVDDGAEESGFADLGQTGFVDENGLFSALNRLDFPGH